MRVLTVVNDLRPGGAQRVARNFALGYRAYGVESALYAYLGGGPLEQSLREAGVEVFIGAPGDGSHSDVQRRALAWLPDVVHIHRPGLPDKRTGPILHAAKTLRRAYTSAAVGVLETSVFGRVDYSTAAECIDIHLHLSKWCLWRWNCWARLQRPRPFGVVLPNLVMHEQYKVPTAAARVQFRDRHGIPQGALLFGRVGSPISSKWSTTVLDAFQKYAAGNAHAWLLLVGFPPEFRRTVAVMPDPIRRRVQFIDFIQGEAALSEAYAAMDVFLHASRIGESFGMVLAEALLCGTPIITLSTPCKDNSQLEVVGHEHGGFVVADVPGMVRAMRQLEDARLRSHYAALGAAAVRQRFAPGVLMPQAVAIARLAAEGLPQAEFRQRVLDIPGLVATASADEIRDLMRRCLGRYRVSDLALMHLVCNPLIYMAYLRLARRVA